MRHAPGPDGDSERSREGGYSALIRTYNSENTIAQTLDSLCAQTTSPSQWVIVDSGSTDRTLDMTPEGSIVHKYVGDVFNYSNALNQGVDLVDREFTLIISSHSSLVNRNAIEFAIALLKRDPKIAAAYFLPGVPMDPASFDLIHAGNFSGFNGIFNTCALVRTALLKKRRFRPEVFAAEDQEWSKWAIEVEKKFVARISGAGMQYRNEIKDRRKKDLYEELAVAMFVKPAMFDLSYIIRVLYRIIRPISTREKRFHNFRLLRNLLYYKMRGKPDTIQIFSKK